MGDREHRARPLYLVSVADDRRGEERRASYFFTELAAAIAFLAHARATLGPGGQVALTEHRSHSAPLEALDDPSPFPELRRGPRPTRRPRD